MQPAPNGRESIVTYIIEEGALYTLRSVQIQIATDGDNEPVFDQKQIAGLISIKAGDVYSVRELEESLEIVRSAYGQMGYVDATQTQPQTNVFRAEKRNPDLPQVDLIISITEGPRYRVGEVIIQGNDLTRQEVIRRQIELRPTRPLDTTAMERSKIRLRRLRLFNERTGARITPQQPGVEFFSEVWDDEYLPRARRPKRIEDNESKNPSTSLSLSPDTDDTYRDVLIEIEETNTGSFDIGGAVSSDSGVIGRIALTQRNFDILDTPDSPGEFFSGRAFRGGGQTFQIELLPGNRVQTYAISLSEPYLLESKYSGSANLFYRNRDFDEFDEKRAGTRLGLGRRFGTRSSRRSRALGHRAEPPDGHLQSRRLQPAGRHRDLAQPLDARLDHTHDARGAHGRQRRAGDGRLRVHQDRARPLRVHPDPRGLSRAVHGAQPQGTHRLHPAGSRRHAHL